MTPLKGSDTLLNQILLSNLITGKCAPMQAVKQLVRGRASETEERRSSFRTNYGLRNGTSFASDDNVSSKCFLIKDGKNLIWKVGSFLPI